MNILINIPDKYMKLKRVQNILNEMNSRFGEIDECISIIEYNDFFGKIE